MRHALAVALTLALTACQAPSTASLDIPAPIAWEGRSAAKQFPDLEAQSYHRDGVARAFEALTEPPALSVQAWDEQRVAQARDGFLTRVGAMAAMPEEVRQTLQAPAWQPRWRAAFEGRDVSAALEVAAWMRQASAGTTPEANDVAPTEPLSADTTIQALIAALADLDDVHTWHVAPAKAAAHDAIVLRQDPLQDPTVEVLRERWKPEGDAPAAEIVRMRFTFLYETGQDGNGAGEDVAAALADLEANPEAPLPQAVVLDLRECRGGDVREAAQIAGLFVDGGTLFQLRGRGSNLTPISDEEPGQAWTETVQIWVGPQTGSSCEAMAQAIDDHNPRSTIIGWPTYGKGTIQRRFELDFDALRQNAPSRLGQVWVTSGEIYGPRGHSLQRTGVHLDVRLPGGVDEPWGERAQERSLMPRPPLDEALALAETVMAGLPENAMHPGMPEDKALVLWQRVGNATLWRDLGRPERY